MHLSKIAELMNMRASLAVYHLSIMEKNNLVIDMKDEGGHYKRFYVKDCDVGAGEKKIIALLRQEPLLKIILLLLKTPSMRHKEMLENLDVASSTLSYQLNKLVESGIIDVFHYGKDRGYNLKKENEIIWIIERYGLDDIFIDEDEIDDSQSVMLEK